jgi:hypothetical protein
VVEGRDVNVAVNQPSENAGELRLVREVNGQMAKPAISRLYSPLCDRMQDR